MLLTVGRKERFKAVAFTSANSKMQTYLFTQVDGVALAHTIPTVTRKTVAGNLEGEQMLSLKLGPNKENTQRLSWMESMWYSTHHYIHE